MIRDLLQALELPGVVLKDHFEYNGADVVCKSAEKVDLIYCGRAGLCAWIDGTVLELIQSRPQLYTEKQLPSHWQRPAGKGPWYITLTSQLDLIDPKVTSAAIKEAIVSLLDGHHTRLSSDIEGFGW